jgi:hypothetical protein
MLFDVLQEMKETTMNDCEYRKMQEAEVAEELAHRIALKRVALEEAARSPTVSKYQWIYYVFIGGLLLYFHDHLADYIWYIVLLLAMEIRTSSSAVHARIDAILELERQRLDAQREEQMKNAEQDASGNRR